MRMFSPYRNNVIYRGNLSPLPTSLCVYLLHTFFLLLTEAVVVIKYEKQHDGELTLNVGDVITHVKRVCKSVDQCYLKPQWCRNHWGSRGWCLL